MYRVGLGLFVMLFLVGGLPYTTITIPRGQPSPTGALSTGPMSEEHEEERHDGDEHSAERRFDRPPPISHDVLAVRELVRIDDVAAPALATCVALPLHPSQYSVRRLI